MMSVVTYGRNDSHGYNLPKRAAISLNCIAELLTDREDEILFVDYNTSDDLPTFIEAIYDTLTDRAKRLLRVFRVRPAIHRRLLGGRTHLAAIEPISRNIGIRRSNPRNRWILCTNPDMIFVGRDGTPDLTSATADLADGHYVLPRFDLPEPLWEAWPRMDPRAVIRACDELGAALHLNTITTTYPFIRFESPGDFQLVPRQTLFDVCGFDERMIHGWHVDSNLGRRMSNLFGRTESLANRLKGYHCDHMRVATLVNRFDLKIENDLQEFVFQVTDPCARHQAATWGLPDEPIEEVDFVTGPAARFTSALRTALGSPQTADYEERADHTGIDLACRPEHVLPYLAGCLTVHASSTSLLYIGANRRLFDLLDRSLSAMGWTNVPRFVRETMDDTVESPDDGRSVSRSHAATDGAFARSLVTTCRVLVFDLGLDAAGLPRPAVRVTDWPRTARHRLGAVARLLAACADQCHELFAGSPDRAPDFVVVNANPRVFSSLVSQFLFTTQTPYNIRVRTGKPRLGADRLYRSHHWKATEAVLSSFFGYGGDALPPIKPGAAIDLTTSGEGHVHKDGQWGDATVDGTWIDGPRAELLLAIDPVHTGDLLAQVSVARLDMPGDEPFRIHVLLQEQPIARWAVHPRSGLHTHALVLPRRLLDTDRPCCLAFEIDNGARSAPARTEASGRDPHGPRVMVRGVTFHETDQATYRIGSQVSCTVGQQGAFYMNCGWTAPDTDGSWTLGQRAGLTLSLEDAPQEPLIGTLTITDTAIGEAFPHLDVQVLVTGQEVERWRLIGRSRQQQKLLVTPEALRRHPLDISFYMATPRSPADLQWSSDSRPLGFRVRSLRIAPLLRYRLGQTIDFGEGGNAEDYLWSNWATPDPDGRWTEGEEATLRFRLDPGVTRAQTASFLISDCMVDGRASSSHLAVQVLANGTLVDEWEFGQRRPQIRAFDLAPDLLSADRDLVVAFRVREPRSPASLGWSSDRRPLGIRLARACLGGDPLHVRPETVVVSALRARARSLAARARRWRPR